MNNTSQYVHVAEYKDITASAHIYVSTLGTHLAHKILERYQIFMLRLIANAFITVYSIITILKFSCKKVLS